MPLVVTIVLSMVAGLFLVLAWQIGHRGSVDLIAGYTKGTYPDAIETQLARDVRNVLVLISGLCCVLIVEAWVRPVWWTELVVGGVLLVSVGWLLWKYNVTY